MFNGNIKISIKNILFLFLGVRFFYLCFQLIAGFLTGNPFSFVYTIMDSNNYIHIATYGYNENKYYAFFPLIPILIRYCSIYGVIFINGLCTLLSAFLLNKLFGKECVTLFLLSPIQIYCYIPYTESIFILCTILSYYFYKNKNWFLMGISLGIGVCDRSVTSMMFFSLFIGMCILLKKKDIKLKDIFIAYIPATIISCLYPIFLYIKTGSFFTFAAVQYEYWDAIKGNIFSIIYKDIQSFFVQDLYGKYLILLTYITLLLLIITLFKCKDIVLFLYTIFTILIIFSTGKQLYMEASFPPSTSYFRYFLSCFPIYIIFGSLKNQKYLKILFIIFHFLIACNFILSGWPF